MCSGVDEFFKPEFFFSSLVIRTSFFKTGTWWRIENQHWSGCHNILFRQKLWIRHLALRLITHVVRLLHLCKMSEKVALIRTDWRRGGRPAMCAHFEKYYRPKIVVKILWRAPWKILSTQNNCPRPMTCISKNIINLKIFVNVLHRARWKILTIWKYLPTSYNVHVDKYHICSDLLILVVVFTRQSSSAPRWELRLTDLSATCHSYVFKAMSSLTCIR